MSVKFDSVGNRHACSLRFSNIKKAFDLAKIYREQAQLLSKD